MSRKQKGFSMAEMLIALLAVSVIVSATIPTFTRKDSTNEKVFSFTAGGGKDGYACPNDGCSIVIGDNIVHQDNRKIANNSVTNLTQRNTNLNLVQNYEGGRDNNIISGNSSNSHLQFYNKNTRNDGNKIYNVGRMYFDETNLGIGINVLGYLDVGPRPSGNETIDYGRRNTAFGQLALLSFASPSSIRKGTDNTGIGFDAVMANTNNSQARFIDLSPLTKTPQMAGNLIFGRPAGSGNTGVGSFALTRNGNGMYNTALGRAALYNPHSKNSYNANANTAVGFHSMIGANTEGVNCSVIDENTNGVESITRTPIYQMYGEGSGNTALGAFTLSHNTTGFGNVAIGIHAMHRNMTGGINVAIGPDAMSERTEGTASVAIGANAARQTKNDNMSIAIGYDALQGNPTPTSLPAQVHDAVKSTILNEQGIPIGTTYGGANIAIGIKALQKANSSDSSSRSTANIALGHWALANYGANSDKNEADYSNIAIGAITMGEIENGSENIAIGVRALNNSVIKNKKTSHNVVIGTNAYSGQAVGDHIGASNYGGWQYDIHTLSSPGANVAIGSYALAGATQSTANVAIGPWAMGNYNNTNVDTDYGNVAIGANAMGKLHSGQGNISIGTHSGYGLNTGNRNIMIGFMTDVKNDESYQLNIGNTITGITGPNAGDRKITIEGDLVVTGNIQTSGNINVNGEESDIKIDGKSLKNHTHDFSYSWGHEGGQGNGTTSTYSDARLKNIGADFTGGIKELNAIEVKNFTFKKDKKKTPHVGVIAQELQKIFPNAVTKDDKGYLLIRTDEIFYSMVNAIKEMYKNLVELTAQVSGLDKKVAELEKQNKEITEQNKLLLEQNKALEKRLELLEKKI